MHKHGISATHTSMHGVGFWRLDPDQLEHNQGRVLVIYVCVYFGGVGTSEAGFSLPQPALRAAAASSRNVRLESRLGRQ